MKHKLEQLEARLEALIKLETDKAKGIPVALSGGIDSSLLSALVKPSFVISVELPGGYPYDEIKYAKKVVKHLKLKHIIVKPEDSKFDEYFENGVRAIGRPIPHFNIFPLYCMYKKLAEMGVKELVLGDGPDETMCGYTRDLIVGYLWKLHEFEGFSDYQELIGKALPNLIDSYAKIINKDPKLVYDCFELEVDFMRGVCRTNMNLMRPDMDDMSNKIAASFGIKNIRPYQDNFVLDNFMLDLPIEAKIYKVEYGKFLLRRIAAKYLPHDIAWRLKKVGGPVYPVNKLKGWLDFGEFDKRIYLQAQELILKNEKQYN